MEKIIQLTVTRSDDWELTTYVGQGSVQVHKTIQTDADGNNKREVTYVTATILLSPQEAASDIIHTVSTPEDQ